MSERFKYRFERWCEKKGGVYAYDEYEKMASCRFSELPDDEDVKDFISFIGANKRSLKKEVRRACMGYYNKLIGGYEEEAYVCYFPRDDIVNVRVKYYSDYGIEGEVMEGEIPKLFGRRETIDTSRVFFIEEVDVEWNRATDEWMGVGYVHTTFSFRTAKKKPDLVVKVLEKASSRASGLAQYALDYVVKT